MTHETVDSMLTDYKATVARCEFLKSDIAVIEKVIDDLKSHAIQDAVSGVQTITDMPHGSGISDPTGKLGTMFASGYEPEYIADLRKEVEAKKRELDYKRLTVLFVDAWLRALNEKELFIIQLKMIDGLFWRDIISQYEKKFGIIYSKQGLKNMKDAAMQKIYKCAE